MKRRHSLLPCDVPWPPKPLFSLVGLAVHIICNHPSHATAQALHLTAPDFCGTCPLCGTIYHLTATPPSEEPQP